MRAVLLVALTIPTLAHAVTIRVGPSAPVHRTISSALEVASPGVEILVEAGEYEESLVITEQVDIVSEDGSAATTITSTDVVITVSEVGFSLTGFTILPLGERGLEITEVPGASQVILDDVVIRDATTDDNGSALYLDEVDDLQIIDCVFQDNTSTDGLGAHVYAKDSTISLVRTTLSGGSATDGGAFRGSDVAVTLTDCTFSDNVAEQGGHVSLKLSSWTDVGGEYTGGVASDEGGAFDVRSVDLSFDGALLDDNSATSGGGGHLNIEREGASATSVLTLVGSTVTGGASGTDGGAIRAISGATVTLEGSTLSGNEATDDGGALYVDDGGPLSVTGATFSANTAGDDGGAIRARNTAVQLGEGALTDNVAGSSGGGVWVTDQPVTVQGTAFERNQAGTRGGALGVDEGDLSVTGSSFVDNTATSDGGAVYVHEGEVDLHESALSGGVGARGGAVYAEAHLGVSIGGASFSDNEATGRGGALCLRQGADAVVSDTAFRANHGPQGGAVDVDGDATLALVRNLFCDNHASNGDGGAVRVFGVTGATSLRNNTFVENVASEDGGGLAVTDAQLSVAFNSFLGNAAVEGGGAWVQDSTLGFANNLVAWTAAGDGLVVGWSGSAPTLEFDYGAWYDNTTTDVSGAASAAWLGANSLFVEPGLESYTPGATDCHAAGWWLGLDSPLIDAGDPSIEDLDGSVADIGSWGGPDADPDDWADADDDGFPALWDCDDTDDGAYPGNEEVPYDGSDNDCQDGDLTDVDGDGYDGEEVEGGDDCDDDEPTTYPGADEVLDDGIDQDCDGKDAAYGDGTVRTWAWEDTGVTPSGDGCACASASPVGAWGLLGLLLGVGRRRRR